MKLSTTRLIATVQFWHHPLHEAAVSSAAVLAVGETLDCCRLERHRHQC